MAQRERRLDRARRRGRERVAGHCPAVVVDDDGEPGAARRAARVRDLHVQHRVVGLPHLVGGRRLAPMHQLVSVAVVDGVADRGPHRRRHGAHDLGRDRVARRREPALGHHGADASVDGRRRGSWPRKGPRADHGLQLGADAAPATAVRPRLALEPGDPLDAVARQPPAQGALPRGLPPWPGARAARRPRDEAADDGSDRGLRRRRSRAEAWPVSRLAHPAGGQENAGLPAHARRASRSLPSPWSDRKETLSGKHSQECPTPCEFLARSGRRRGRSCGGRRDRAREDRLREGGSFRLLGAGGV